MKVCLYGSASKKIDKQYTDAVYELGLKIAENNHVLVYGAGNTGIMGAAASGVFDNGGEIIGISPGWIEDKEDRFDNCTEFIETDTLDVRK